MRRIVGVILCSMVGSLLLSSVALAVRPGEPKKANKVQLTLARNWADQGTVNDTLTGLGLPAHHPAATTDACAFDPAIGGGKLSATVTGTPDIKFAIKLAGVTGCEGQNLCLAATIKLTTLGCTSGDVGGCTAGPTSFDAILSGAGLCCTVVGGKCTLATSANAAFSTSLITAGQQINAQILDSGVTHGANRAFSSALFVP